MAGLAVLVAAPQTTLVLLMLPTPTAYKGAGRGRPHVPHNGWFYAGGLGRHATAVVRCPPSCNPPCPNNEDASHTRMALCSKCLVCRGFELCTLQWRVAFLPCAMPRMSSRQLRRDSASLLSHARKSRSRCSS